MSSPEHRGGINVLTQLRRSAVALGVAGLVAVVLRPRRGSTPPTRGGWRYLTPEELADPQVATDADISLPDLGELGIVSSAEETPSQAEASLE